MDGSVSLVGVCLFERLPLSDDEDAPDAAAVADPDEDMEATHVEVSVVTFATLADRSVTTGYEEPLGLAIEAGLSGEELRREVAEFLAVAGWWDVLSETLADEAGIQLPESELEARWTSLEVAPALAAELLSES